MKKKRTKGWGIALIVLGVLTLPFGIPLIIVGVLLMKRTKTENSTMSPPEQALDIDTVDAPTPTVSLNPLPDTITGATFGSWDTSVHLADGQLFRFGRAVYGDFDIRPFSKEIVKITGSKGTVYHTSLDTCDCPDFEKRHLPCKHIYSLALSLGYSIDDFYSAYLDVSCDDGTIPRPVVGYSNGLKTYCVHGVNPETNRRNKRTVFAMDEVDAVASAHGAGLNDPIDVDGLVDPSEFRPVNDWQKELLQQQNIAIPTCADYYDAKALLCRIDSGEMSTIPVGLLKFATKCHIPCSLLIDPLTLLEQLLNQLPRREQIALYAGAVRCADNGVSIANQFDDPISDSCYAFADFAYNDEKLYRDLLNNLSVDVLSRPPKKTATYRAVIKFFQHADDQA